MPSPGFDQDTGFGQRVEDLAVENRRASAGVKPASSIARGALMNSFRILREEGRLIPPREFSDRVVGKD